jgi:molybdate transport system substrate-binding protein
VIWVPRSSPLPIERDGLQALLHAPRVAIANPRHAPYGRAAEAALRAAGLWERIEPRLVLGENIAQAAQFVQSGAAAAGIIARSVTRAPAMRAAGRVYELPLSSHPEIRQGGLVLPWATSREAALAVRDFLLGREGQAVLVDSGFDLPR